MSAIGELNVVEVKKKEAAATHVAPEKRDEIKISIPKFDIKEPNWLYYLLLLPVFALSLFIRTRNLPILEGRYLIELDSYYFFRYSKMLLEQGSVPAIDMMRYVPEGFPTATSLFFPKTMVFFYKIIHMIFPNLSQMEWHIIYPPVITIISFVFFFLFLKELLNSHRIAFISTAFLAVIPAYIQRTGAGFADHEAFAMLWMFISLWLFVLAWKSDNWKAFMPMAAASGLFAGAMAATWGGYILFVSGISLFVFSYVLLTNKSRGQLLRFLPWSIVYFFSAAYFWSQPISSFVKHLPNLILFFVVAFLLVHLLLQKLPKLKELKVPYSITSLLATIGILLPLSFVTGFLNLKDFLIALTKEGASRHFFTVSENAQPYFLGGWWDSFGWIFLLAFIGSILYFYKIFKPEDKSKLKLHWLAAGAYVIFFFAFIFGRLSPAAKFASVVSFFSNTYLWWIAGFVVLLGAIYLLAYYKDPVHLEEIEKKWPWLLLAVWLLVVLLAARGQIRLLFAVVPPVAIAAGILVSEIIDWAKAKQGKLKYAAFAGIALFSMFAIAVAAEDSMLQNRYSGSIVSGQWDDSMTWIKENTPENAIFAHWWDYGYMTIAVGERAAVTDGGNALGWNHQSGRYLLTGKDDISTLTYLKTHNVTHILISDEEILKYHAFSFIGSDEELDRQSTIGVFGLQQKQEVRNGTRYLYGGGWALDKDYVIGKVILPKDKAGIVAFSFMTDENGMLSDPKAHAVYNNQQYDISITCVIVQGKKLEFEYNDNSSYIMNGCLMLVPFYNSPQDVVPQGGAYWLSEKVWDTNFARLYMYGEGSEYFEKVYDDQTPLSIYQGRPIGPIKIWEVKYPENVTADEFYLQASPYG